MKSKQVETIKFDSYQTLLVLRQDLFTNSTERMLQLLMGRGWAKIHKICHTCTILYIIDVSMLHNIGR